MKKLKNKFFTLHTEKSICNYIRILHTDFSVCKPVLYTDFGSYIRILTVCNSNFSCSDTTSHFFFECIIVWLRLNSVDHLVPTSHFLPFNLFGAPTSVNLVFGNVWIVLVSEI